MRGRPSGNRRGPNPLTRSYESNGPDVKIRGNAHHIAEKYLQLARDAHTSGDPVAAENYLQHAEHYFRLIASAQAAQLAAQGRPPGEAEAEDLDEDDDGGVLDRFASPAERAPAFNPQQPYAQQPQPGGFGYGGDRQTYDGERPAQAQPQPQPHGERNGFQPRGDRNNFQPRGDRRPPFNERGEGGPREHRGPQEHRQPREFRNNYREMNPQREPQPVVEEPAAGLPSFITAAPRIPAPAESLDAPQPVIESAAPPAESAEAAPVQAEEGLARNPRGRRRRLRSPYGFHAGDEEQTAPSEAPPSE